MTIAEAAPPPDAPEHRPGTPQRLAYLYDRHLVKADREDRFLVWVAFTTTLVVPAAEVQPVTVTVTE